MTTIARIAGITTSFLVSFSLLVGCQADQQSSSQTKSESLHAQYEEIHLIDQEFFLGHQTTDYIWRSRSQNEPRRKKDQLNVDIVGANDRLISLGIALERDNNDATRYDDCSIYVESDDRLFTGRDPYSEDAPYLYRSLWSDEIAAVQEFAEGREGSELSYWVSECMNAAQIGQAKMDRILGVNQEQNQQPLTDAITVAWDHRFLLDESFGTPGVRVLAASSAFSSDPQAWDNIVIQLKGAQNRQANLLIVLGEYDAESGHYDACNIDLERIRGLSRGSETQYFNRTLYPAESAWILDELAKKNVPAITYFVAHCRTMRHTNP